MASGWAQDGAVQDQIDDNISDAVSAARNQLNKGESLTHCEECDLPIPEARRKALQGVHLCIKCQAILEETQQTSGGINRRASKDSQLR
ncbi:UNVERIFIED_CONTAM: hypothetical protein GTU68_062093 [Idotea baltica]|nr:hypothetical protein [Idotea baltica]